MDFNLSPESEMRQKTSAKKILPITESIIKTNDYPQDLLLKFAKAPMLGLSVPKEYGGVGTTNLSIVSYWMVHQRY